ncbi:DNA replication/repair protein RecF [Rhodanobacter sp. DHB23]|uniref:DNA replication/repair protein RecF n=1 Tax=Rhodanobacter sp. DHB23 TaxID=2775923 RepID=UPI0017829809|nr:DNA replication/repair protein RecF [Rhodanobacter sp. DHB23]MBD8874553.1 DNA replication/repair protein RecF [Rhodanobacter sp. DHB23]
MRLDRLRIQNLRCLREVDLALAPGINVFVGANGAGKTSVLEAVFLLSHARSFRSGAREALLARGAVRLAVFAELRQSGDRVMRLGLGREASRWEARLEGENVSLGELIAECAVACFEPGSHALIAGAAEERRRYLDWGVFHVEHAFLDAWRRYQRALKQRNSLLRAGNEPGSPLYAPWETELATLADWLDDQRCEYLDRLRPHLQTCLTALLPELGGPELRYRRGWAEEKDLREQLEAQRGRDLARGHTSLGAHRADWSLAFEHAPQREHLSRGQEKLAALGCMLAQARLYADQHGDSPIICLDDLASELDEAHQTAVIGQLVDSGAQVLVSGTGLPEPLRGLPHRMFHVEQGQLTPLL